MKLILRSSLLTLSLCLHLFVHAQEAPPFWGDVLAFKHQDAIDTPIQHPILFIGSSSFTIWKNLKSDLPGYPVMNRAFGGSTLTDVIRYFYEVVVPYQPKQVVVYCGENDIAYSDSVTANDVLLRVKTLFAMVRANFPNTRFSYVSIKPSPSRAQMQDRVRQANQLIKKFLSTQKNTDYINIYDAMLDSNGNMRKEIYLDDQLHMNEKGYGIWIPILKKYLVSM
jgi:lysophospholipase L1-like esterase